MNIWIDAQSINKNLWKFVTRLIVTPFKSDRHSQFYLSFGFLFQLFLWYFFAFIVGLMFSQRISNLKPNKMTVEVVNLCPIEAEIYYFFLPQVTKALKLSSQSFFFVGRFKRSSSFFLWRYLFLHEEISFLQQKPIFQGEIFFFLLFSPFYEKNSLFPHKKTFFQLFQCIFSLSTEVNSENSPKEVQNKYIHRNLKCFEMKGWDKTINRTAFSWASVSSSFLHKVFWKNIRATHKRKEMQTE